MCNTRLCKARRCGLGLNFAARGIVGPSCWLLWWIRFRVISFVPPPLYWPVPPVQLTMRNRSFLTLFLLALVFGCSDSIGPGISLGPPATLSGIGGSDQQAAAGSVAPESLSVRVTDARGRPVPGTPVTWTVTAGGGSVTPTTTRTDAAGKASASWTLGTLAGENTATATVSGLLPVSFGAVGTAGAPAELTKMRGEGQSGAAGSALSDTLAVRVTDAHGNPIRGVAVTWTVSSGGGAVSVLAPSTDSAGGSRAVWTLGTAAGENIVTARVDGVPAVTFTATATPGAPAALEKVSGDAQSGTTGQTLPDPLAVRVTDAFGNSVGGISVGWTATRGGGRISPASATTNAAGLADASWQLGDSIGSQTASAVVSGTGLGAQFTATAEPAHPGFADPVQLVPGTTVGKPTFPIGNTSQGGQGEPIGGVSCIDGMIAYHEHAHVSLFINGTQIAIPAGIGIVNPREQNGFVQAGDCFYWLHTHDATGVIHVEPPSNQQLTLGQLFEVWGRPLSATNVAGFEGPVTIYVDGERYRGDPRAIAFAQHREITLQVGMPLAPIPQYLFPEGY